MKASLFAALLTATVFNLSAATAGTAPDMHDFLYFVGLNDNDTVKLNKSNASLAATFQYSTDRIDWSDYTWPDKSGLGGYAIVLPNAGDTVFFRAKGTNGLYGVFADSTLTEQKWVITNNAVTPAAVGSFVAQYRCFIDLGQTPVDDDAFTQQVPGRHIFNVKNTPTGMEMLEETSFPLGEDRGEASKMMIDGKLIIIRDGKVYNAQGAIVD